MGDSWSCTYLGELFVEGNGVTKDVSKGKQYLVEACNRKEDNHARACWVMAKRLDKEHDQREAKKNFPQSCTGDEILGCYYYVEYLERQVKKISNQAK